MFGDKRIRELESEVAELRRKYSDLEGRVSTCEIASTGRIGEVGLDVFCGYRKDSRPTLRAMDAIHMIMRHLGLKVQHIDATPAQFELVAQAKSKK